MTVLNAVSSLPIIPKPTFCARREWGELSKKLTQTFHVSIPATPRHCEAHDTLACKASWSDKIPHPLSCLFLRIVLSLCRNRRCMGRRAESGGVGVGEGEVSRTFHLFPGCWRRPVCWCFCSCHWCNFSPCFFFLFHQLKKDNYRNVCFLSSLYPTLSLSCFPRFLFSSLYTLPSISHSSSPFYTPSLSLFL